MEIHQSNEYRLFLRKYLYSNQSMIVHLIEMLKKGFDTNNINYDQSSCVITLKIKKSYMKKNNVLENNIQFYYHNLGNILGEYFHSNTTNDYFIMNSYNNKDFDNIYETFQKIRGLSGYEIISLINGMCVNENYLIICL